MKNKIEERNLDNNEVQKFVTQLYLLLLSSIDSNGGQNITKLNTDLIESKFGKVNALIHEHTDYRRVIDIVDVNGMSITHAVTWFPMLESVSDLIQEEREIIKNGSLIGKTFKSKGYQIEKPELLSGVVSIPKFLSDKFESNKNTAKFKIYQFICVKGKQNSLYGIVTEIYSPKFKSVENRKIINTRSLRENNEKFVFSQLKNYLRTLE